MHTQLLYSGFNKKGLFSANENAAFGQNMQHMAVIYWLLRAVMIFSVFKISVVYRVKYI